LSRQHKASKIKNSDLESEEEGNKHIVDAIGDVAADRWIPNEWSGFGKDVSGAIDDDEKENVSRNDPRDDKKPKAGVGHDLGKLDIAHHLSDLRMSN
jgi:hypothetical protein